MGGRADETHAVFFDQWNIGKSMRQLFTLAVLILTMCIAYAGNSDVPRCPLEIEPEERVLPIYPTDTRKAGWVMVEFTILTDGGTGSSNVVESSSRIFERSALQAILKYRYAERIASCVHRERVNYVME